MFDLFVEIINGKLKPHLIDNENLSEIQNRLDKLNEKRVKKDSVSSSYKYWNLKNRKEFNYYPNSKDDNNSDELSESEFKNLIEYKLSKLPDKKAELYADLIKIETNCILENIGLFLNQSSDADTISFYALKNIQLLKSLAWQLKNYILEIGGVNTYLSLIDSDHFITNDLSNKIILIIQHIQKTFSPFLKIKEESTIELKQSLFEQETSPRHALAYLCIKNYLSDNEHIPFRSYFKSTVNETLERSSTEYRNISLGLLLFNFYKVRAESYDKTTLINYYRGKIYYWKKLLTADRLKTIDFDNSRNEPEIEKVLIPLLEGEIKNIESKSKNTVNEDDTLMGFSCKLGEKAVNKIFDLMSDKEYIKADIRDFRKIFAPESTPIKNKIEWIPISQRTKRGHQIKLYMFLETVFSGKLSLENRRKAVHLFVDKKGEFFNAKMKRPNKYDRNNYDVFKNLLKDILK